MLNKLRPPSETQTFPVDKWNTIFIPTEVKKERMGILRHPACSQKWVQYPADWTQNTSEENDDEGEGSGPKQ